MTDVLRETGIVLRARRRMVTNTLLRLVREQRSLAAAVAVAAGIAMLAAYGIAGAVFDVGGESAAAVDRVIAGALSLLCGFVAVTSVTFALSSLYFGRDMETLLSTPMRPASILLSRMLTQLATGAGLGAAIAGPPLVALAVAAGRPLVVPVAAAAVLALAVVPLTLATALVVAAVRLIPARYVRDAGGAVVGISVLAIAGINIAVRGGDVVSGGVGRLDLGGYAASPLDSVWSPLGWARRGIGDALRGDAGMAVLWVLPLLVLALALLMLVARAGERPFVGGWQRNAAASRGRRSRRTVSSATAWGPRALHLVLKDVREIRRDASQVGQLLLPIVMFALYIGSPGHNPGELSVSVLPPWFGDALTASFAALFAASGIALRGVGSEGSRIWLLRAAPISPRELLTAKFIVGFVIACGLGMLLLILGVVRAGVGLLATAGAVVTLAILIAGLVGIASGLGALRPRFDWTDPRRAVGIGTTLGFILAGTVYITVCFVAVAVSYVVGGHSAAAPLASAITVAVVAVAAGGSTLWVGARSLARLET